MSPSRKTVMSSFPDDFTWGAATSAHQVEGGNTNSDWWRLEHSDDAPTAEPSGDACDSYHRFGEDISLLAAAGLDSYRFSIEWARIEPAPGEFSTAALDHYQRMIDTCLGHDVEPVVTLHHFTNPAWMRDLGGWEAPGAEQRFATYVDKALSTLEGVRRVCTINEPNMIAMWTGALNVASTGADPRPDAPTRDVL